MFIPQELKYHVVILYLLLSIVDGGSSFVAHICAISVKTRPVVAFELLATSLQE